VPIGVDGHQGLGYERGFELARDGLEPPTLGRLVIERLLDGERPVNEVRLGRHEGQLDAVSSKVANRNQRLKPGDSPAGDHRLHVVSAFAPASSHRPHRRTGPDRDLAGPGLSAGERPVSEAASARIPSTSGSRLPTIAGSAQRPKWSSSAIEITATRRPWR
jgi:hypothetical protein